MTPAHPPTSIHSSNYSVNCTMASNSELAASTKSVAVILNDQDEWQLFMNNVYQAAEDMHIWELINPALPEQPEVLLKPQKPTAATATSGAKTEEASLSDREIQILALQQKNYQFDQADWKAQDAALTIIHKYIREHITLPNHVAIAGSRSVWDTLRRLRERNEPTDEAYKLDLQYK